MPKKIMIIDDEPDIRIYLVTLLEDHGYNACSPEEGVSAIEFVKREKPDLIFMDVMMPGQSGISIYKELQKCSDLKNIPVVMMSGAPFFVEFTPEGFREMANDEAIPLPSEFIDKPVQIDFFIKVVKKLAGETGT